MAPGKESPRGLYNGNAGDRGAWSTHHTLSDEIIERDKGKNSRVGSGSNLEGGHRMVGAPRTRERRGREKHQSPAGKSVRR